MAANRIHIFRAGRHVDVHGRPVEFTRAQLADIATSYSAEVGEAPLVVGHPRLDDPAHGWVERLEVEGDDLYMVPAQVNPEFAARVERGEYKKVSPSFFLPDSPGNPTPGKMYLKHVGFLGAAVPAVPGLRPAAFAADAQAVAIEFAAGGSWLWGTIGSLLNRLRDSIVARDGVEAAEQTLPQWEIDSIRNAAVEQRVIEQMPILAEIDAAPEAVPAFAAAAGEAPIHPETGAAAAGTPAAAAAPMDFAARDAELAAREAAIAAREAELQAEQRARAREEVASFAASLVGSGRLLPREQPMVVELLSQLGEAPQALSFAAADGAQVTADAAASLRELLAALPPRVPMGEVGADHSASVPPVAFAAPPGAVVDPEQLELLAKARAYQSAHPGVSIIDAARAVSSH